MDDHELVTRFLEHTLTPDGFTHREHVRLTYLLLERLPLPETMIALRDGIKAIAAKAGRPEKYHETITFAYAMIIAERRAARGYESFVAFAADHEDLLVWNRGDALAPWYDPALLETPEARLRMILPPRHGRGTSKTSDASV